jgi:hypothetical protein
MVGLQVLVLTIGVRIPVPEHGAFTGPYKSRRLPLES